MLVPAMLEDGSTVEAWVYVMNIIPPQAKVIPSGSWNHREDDRQRCPGKNGRVKNGIGNMQRASKNIRKK